MAIHGMLHCVSYKPLTSSVCVKLLCVTASVGLFKTKIMLTVY